jgi:osmotically-inducible protein OsmY
VDEMKIEKIMKKMLFLLLLLTSINSFSYSQIEDESQEKNLSRAINQIILDNGRVSVKSYKGCLLITGQVNNQKLFEDIQKLTNLNIGIKRVVNDVIVTTTINNFDTRLNDRYIEKKVKNALRDSGNKNEIGIHSEQGVVYLMGQVTIEEGKKAAIDASYAGGGIKRIIKLFEYVTDDEDTNYVNQIKNANDKDKDIERERQQLVEERRKFEEEKRTREQARNNQRLSLQVTNTQPNSEGDFVINIQTGTDTASLKINGEELGGRVDGSYAIKKVARAGQETKFTIVARDINGNTDNKSILVTRQVTASNAIKYAELNPSLVKTQPSKDAVAIIIGIQNYKRVPKAEFANNDAQAFYDYAIRALGVKPENIKLLVDEQADEVEILSAFQNWLPVKVRKQKTDVYVYYSGHGLPSDDGNSLYILPHGADKQFIAKTAINQQEVVAALQASQPKSVTMFMDACYSGQIRTGENLIASARPIAIKSNAQLFPAEFTVITASQSDQIASSSADFKHGIFSYYLMKGMEGDADENKDNKITVGEMQSYLQDMVGRKAMSVNRKQIPQLTGDANRVLVGK